MNRGGEKPSPSPPLLSVTASSKICRLERTGAVTVPRPSPKGPRLPNGTRYCRKRIVGIGPNNPHRADHNHENHSEHHGIFHDVLIFIVHPKPCQRTIHGRPPTDECCLT